MVRKKKKEKVEKKNLEGTEVKGTRIQKKKREDGHANLIRYLCKKTKGFWKRGKPTCGRKN